MTADLPVVTPACFKQASSLEGAVDIKTSLYGSQIEISDLHITDTHRETPACESAACNRRLQRGSKRKRRPRRYTRTHTPLD